jgi:hypothetical protein
MIEKILSRRNIREACKQVVSNQGSAGVDGMSVKGIPYRPMHKRTIGHRVTQCMKIAGFSDRGFSAHTF